MNKRIREIAEQAKNFMSDQVLYQSRVHNKTLSVDESADIFEGKFAELIVKECVDGALEAQADYYVIESIKSRLGVENESSD